MEIVATLFLSVGAICGAIRFLPVLPGRCQRNRQTPSDAFTLPLRRVPLPAFGEWPDSCKAQANIYRFLPNSLTTEKKRHCDHHQIAIKFDFSRRPNIFQHNQTEIRGRLKPFGPRPCSGVGMMEQNGSVKTNLCWLRIWSLFAVIRWK